MAPVNCLPEMGRRKIPRLRMRVESGGAQGEKEWGAQEEKEWGTQEEEWGMGGLRKRMGGHGEGREENLFPSLF